MENVKGLASTLVDPADKQSLPLLDHILEKFKALGYHTVHGVLDAVATFLRGLPEDQWLHAG